MRSEVVKKLHVLIERDLDRFAVFDRFELHLLFDEVSVVLTLLDDDVRHRVHDSQVVTRNRVEMNVGHATDWTLSRVQGDNQDVPARLLAGEDLIENHRVTFRRIGTDQKENLGMFDVIVASHRLVFAEGADVPADRAGHAQTRVALDVVRADPAFEKPVGQIAFLAERLTRTVIRHAVRAMLLDRLGELVRQQFHGFIDRKSVV